MEGEIAGRLHRKIHTDSKSVWKLDWTNVAYSKRNKTGKSKNRDKGGPPRLTLALVFHCQTLHEEPIHIQRSCVSLEIQRWFISVIWQKKHKKKKK